MTRKGGDRKTTIKISQAGKQAKLTYKPKVQTVKKPELKGMELKQFLWKEVKKLGNDAKLKWQTSIAQMQDYVSNFKKYRPLQITETGRVSFLKNRITGKQYVIKNFQDASKHNLTPIVQKLDDNTTFAMPVTLKNGSTSYRTFDKKSLLECINNDFQVTSTTLGSDNIEKLEYTLDLSREFRINEVTQKSDVQAMCNRQKNRIRTIGRCQVRDIYTRHNNCGFQVLKELGCQTNMPLKEQGGLSTKEMIDIVEHYNFPIQIIDTNGDILYSHPDHVDKTIVISIEEQHWYVFIQFTKTKEEVRENNRKLKQEMKQQLKEQQKKKTVLVCYDLETIFNSKNDMMAETYSLCYFPTLLKDKMEKITKNNINEFLLKTKILWGNDCCKQMINELQKEFPPTEYFYKIISFNGSCFDDYFLIQQAVDSDENIKNCIFSNKSIVGVTFSYGKCWDLRKFLVGSLKGLCDSFDTFPKKIEGFDHRLPQKAFDNGTLQQWIDQNKAKIEEYNKFDVLALYSLTIKYRESVISLFTNEKNEYPIDADVFQHDTIGGQAYKLCKNKWKEQGIQMRRPQTEELDKYIRKCLTAGRTQVMASKDGKSVYINGRRFQMIDVVSLYPTVMLDPKNFYPCGEQIEVTVRDKSKLGFYHIYVKHREDLPNVLPERDYKGLKSLNWHTKKKFEAWCCSIDLDVLELYGHEFTIIDGVEFSDKISGQELFSCQLVFRDEKIRQDVYKDNEVRDENNNFKYNPAMREVCKLYLNSLSGKVIQRNFTKTTQIVKNDFELNKFMEKCQDGTISCHTANGKFVVMNGEKNDAYSQNAKPSYLGVYIYAHARYLMYTNIYTKVECHYTDTDSALIYYEDFLKFREQNPHLFRKEETIIDGKKYMIKPFGTLDCEMKDFDKQGNWIGCNEAYLLAPKNYMVCNEKTEYYPKLKCKGVSFKGSYCWSCENSLKNLNIQTLIRLNDKCQECDQGFCRYVDGTALYQDKQRLFKEMVQNQECQVICDQLTAKTFTNHHNKNVGIQFRTVTKTITIKSIEYI